MPRIRRFEQEARAASALSHPNVCVVYALGETADGHPFIAMEYIEGQTLRHLLQTQPPTLKAALDIAIQIAAGAGAAHAIGIVHRDLKPENVIVRQDGLVKVLDFGLAKLAPGGLPADDSHATRTLVKTESGVVMGTFTYMAPEQARGQDVDARADIWALGVMLYELVAGRVPFARRDAERRDGSDSRSRDRAARQAQTRPPPRAAAHRRQGAAKGPRAAVSDHHRPAAGSRSAPGRTAGVLADHSVHGGVLSPGGRDAAARPARIERGVHPDRTGTPQARGSRRCSSSRRWSRPWCGGCAAARRTCRHLQRLACSAT